MRKIYIRSAAAILAALMLSGCGNNGMTKEFAKLKEAAESKSGIIYKTTYFVTNEGNEGFPYPEKNSEGKVRFVYNTENGKEALTGYEFDDAHGSYCLVENIFIAPAETDGKWGYVLLEVPMEEGEVAELGETVWEIEPKYENAEAFTEQIAAVKIDGKYGAINENGELVLPAIYDSMKYRSFGVLPASLNGEWYFLGADGNPLFGPFEDAESYEFGFAAVKRDGKWGYIDKNGMDATAFAYDEVYAVEAEGTAWVRTGEKWEHVQVRNY